MEAKLLYRRLDGLLAALDPRRPQTALAEQFLQDCFQALREDLRLRAGVLYLERRDGFAHAKTVGEPAGPVAETLEAEGPPLQLVFRHRVYIFPEPLAEGAPYRLGLLPRAAAAGLVVGRRPNRIVFLFLLDDGWLRDELDFALNTVRAALGSRLTDARVRGSFQQAKEIQESLLEDAPDFPGFDIACRSLAAEEVGGDFYDFHAFDGDMLGLAIGDASGHGLPAALLVRDVVTGLRMGIEKELKIATVFAKLNRVIHRSNLSSRFVSVFYGELEADGNLIYVNAGHPPPVLFFSDVRQGTGELELKVGGTVIGPLPEVEFRRGFARVRPGEVLALCTDGILERRDALGEFFGVDRVRAIVREHQAATAEKILERLFASAVGFGNGRPWEDDATAVIVKRRPEPAAPQ